VASERHGPLVPQSLEMNLRNGHLIDSSSATDKKHSHSVFHMNFSHA